MTNLIIYILFIPIITLLLISINFIFAINNPYEEKKSVFECGYHSFLGMNRTQFSIFFFIVALLFLIFDLEILLIYPFGASAHVNGIYGLIIMIIFFTILTLGFVFELGKKALKLNTTSAKKSSINYNNNILYSNIFGHIYIITSFILMLIIDFFIPNKYDNITHYKYKVFTICIYNLFFIYIIYTVDIYLVLLAPLNLIVSSILYSSNIDIDKNLFYTIICKLKSFFVNRNKYMLARILFTVFIIGLAILIIWYFAMYYILLLFNNNIYINYSIFISIYIRSYLLIILKFISIFIKNKCKHSSFKNAFNRSISDLYELDTSDILIPFMLVNTISNICCIIRLQYMYIYNIYCIIHTQVLEIVTYCKDLYDVIHTQVLEIVNLIYNIFSEYYVDLVDFLSFYINEELRLNVLYMEGPGNINPMVGPGSSKPTGGAGSYNPIVGPGSINPTGGAGSSNTTPTPNSSGQNASKEEISDIVKKVINNRLLQQEKINKKNNTEWPIDHPGWSDHPGCSLDKRDFYFISHFIENVRLMYTTSQYHTFLDHHTGELKPVIKDAAGNYRSFPSTIWFRNRFVNHVNMDISKLYDDFRKANPHWPHDQNKPSNSIFGADWPYKGPTGPHWPSRGEGTGGPIWPNGRNRPAGPR